MYINCSFTKKAAPTSIRVKKAPKTIAPTAESRDRIEASNSRPGGLTSGLFRYLGVQNGILVAGRRRPKMSPNGLANLRQVSGAVLANANMDDSARTVPDTARWQAQRIVRPRKC